MKITEIKVYQIDLPLKKGRYNWPNGDFVEVFDSTVTEQLILRQVRQAALTIA